MAASNPITNSGSKPAMAVSKKQFTIAGILTTVYGLDELPPHADVACLWLLHPRLQTQICMEPIANEAITAYNARRSISEASPGSSRQLGLIAVSFDQRNHGSREVTPLANESWREGNPLHAQDLFSSYREYTLLISYECPVLYLLSLLDHLLIQDATDGTALDTSLLITYLPSYIFPSSEHTITANQVLGVSLGGHAAWNCIVHDPRITTAIIGIGCPDFVRLMQHRASRSKLQTWTSSDPPGSTFIGSKDFPTSLLRAVETWDPAGLLMKEPTEGLWRHSQEKTGESLLARKLGGKRILNLAGGEDKLVPFDCSSPFLHFLGEVVEDESIWGERAPPLVLHHTFDAVGHEMTEGMIKKAVDFIGDMLESGEEGTRAKMDSKM
jgi:pimeloyl-ACP methyl ester carboxylesterase